MRFSTGFQFLLALVVTGAVSCAAKPGLHAVKSSTAMANASFLEATKTQMAPRTDITAQFFRDYVETEEDRAEAESFQDLGSPELED